MINTKKQKIAYWVLTLAVVGLMAMSAVALLIPLPQNVEGMQHLGYPLYFLKILGTAKALGAIALVYKRFRTLTEWAYAGFTFTFLGASYSHFSAGEGIAKTLAPLVVLTLLAGSYHFWKKV